MYSVRLYFYLRSSLDKFKTLPSFCLFLKVVSIELLIAMIILYGFRAYITLL